MVGPNLEGDLSTFQPLPPFLQRQLDGEHLFISDVIFLFGWGQTVRVECTWMDLGVPSQMLRQDGPHPFVGCVNIRDELGLGIRMDQYRS